MTNTAKKYELKAAHGIWWKNGRLLVCVEWVGFPRYEFFSEEPVAAIPIAMLHDFVKQLTPAKDKKFSLTIPGKLQKQKPMGCVPSSIGYLLGLESTFGSPEIHNAVARMLHVREFMSQKICAAQYENGPLYVGKLGAVSGEIMEWLLEKCTCLRLCGVPKNKQKFLRRQMKDGKRVCGRFMLCSYPWDTSFTKAVNKKNKKNKKPEGLAPQQGPKKKRKC